MKQLSLHAKTTRAHRCLLWSLCATTRESVHYNQEIPHDATKTRDTQINKYSERERQNQEAGGKVGPLAWETFLLGSFSFFLKEHSSYKFIQAKLSLCHVWKKVWVHQLCLTLCDPMVAPDSFVRGILQARILEWVVSPFSRGSSQPMDWTWVSCIAGILFTIWAIREALIIIYICP